MLLSRLCFRSQRTLQAHSLHPKIAVLSSLRCERRPKVWEVVSFPHVPRPAPVTPVDLHGSSLAFLPPRHTRVVKYSSHEGVMVARLCHWSHNRGHPRTMTDRRQRRRPKRRNRPTRPRERSACYSSPRPKRPGVVEQQCSARIAAGDRTVSGIARMLGPHFFVGTRKT